jgi:hypothetical protein
MLVTTCCRPVESKGPDPWSERLQNLFHFLGQVGHVGTVVVVVGACIDEQF